MRKLIMPSSVRAVMLIALLLLTTPLSSRSLAQSSDKKHEEFMKYINSPKMNVREITDYLQKKEKNFTNDFGKYYVDVLFAFAPELLAVDFDDETISELLNISVHCKYDVVEIYCQKAYKAKKKRIMTDSLNVASKVLYGENLNDICKRALISLDKEWISNPSNTEYVKTKIKYRTSQNDIKTIKTFAVNKAALQVKAKEDNNLLDILARKLRKGYNYLPSETVPRGYSLYKSESHTYTLKGEQLTESWTTYKNKKGHLLTLRKINSENFMWGLPAYNIDKYTGDTTFKTSNFLPLALRKVCGSDTLIMQSMEYGADGNIGCGKTYRWFLSPNKINIYSERYNGPRSAMELWNEKDGYKSFISSMLPSELPKNRINKTFDERGEVAVFYDKNGEVMIPVSVKDGEYHLKPKQGKYFYFVSFPYYKISNDDFEGIKKYIKYKNLQGNDRYLTFFGSDNIEIVEDKERYFQVRLNEVDQMKVLKVNGEIFDGTLTRPKFKASFQKGGAVVTFLTDTVVNIQEIGDIDIPIGSTYNGTVDGSILVSKNFLSFAFFSESINGKVCDSNGTPFLTLHSGDSPRIDLIGKDKILAERKAKEDAKIASEKDAIYTAYCSKYGKALIDELLKGKLPVGTPESLMKEVYDYELRTNSKGYRQYVVILDSPSYDLRNKTISSRGRTHFGWSSRKAVVSVSNGKVLSITVLN